MQNLKFKDIENSIDNQKIDLGGDQSINPLINAAVPIFNKLVELKVAEHKGATIEILEEFKKRIEGFEVQAEINRVPYESIQAARYCLCTMLDEFATKFGWADQEWNARSLLVTFHNETWGGEQFYQLLDSLKKDALKNIHLIEMMYCCLVLGYMGKYKILNNGKVSVESIKKELEKIIKEHGEEKNPQILNESLVNTSFNLEKRKIIPYWVLFLSGLVIMLMLYGTMKFILNKYSNKLEERMNAMHFVLDKRKDHKYLTPLLKYEIERNLLKVDEIAGKSTITILGDELFSSGSDQINDRYYPVMASIGQALNEVKGRIDVFGYTDDRAINSAKYPSNWHLSQGRSDAVKSILVNYIQDTSRIRAEGRGADVLPSEANTEENRAKNRRVEIVVYIDQKLGQAALVTPTLIENNN
ncbi:type VI secretion system protein TssL, long form [Acinetobacter faecalis]|uniref:type VI secretion system protein TssL, long form n=1 Tax=Acinetobacter faecalis TaxID=2665161 RepID=UPI002A9205A3|nr:type VI secretion system protein TssL, long form [Acinetobacter faecalis]MDY6450942.1 type VI secretion system protein TssL, long form [Acinetobacter faecalis]